MRQTWKFNGMEVYYDEHGAGAFIRTVKYDSIVIHFHNHLDAEEFLDLLPREKSKIVNRKVINGDGDTVAEMG